MSDQAPKLVTVECWGCEGTGLSRGFGEPSGVYALCVICSGSAAQSVYNAYRGMKLEYQAYRGRRELTGVQIVWVYSTRPPAQTHQPGNQDVHRMLSYQDFLAQYPAADLPKDSAA